jgi:flagellar FliL protein
MCGTNFVKIEIMRDSKYLLPDNYETIKATETLAKEGFIVNIGTATSGRYLKIGVILELKPDKKAQAQAGKTLSPEEIKIQDAVLHFLRSQRVEDYDPQKQDRLKDLIKQEVNRVLGREIVYDVYITNILLQ